ncbi:MAG: peptide-methionine (S)-S-oxide reductase MsrA [Elusimicrobiota bacterium]|jgi:peptide methionine sulfoxide reductase msrA/msrB|nr:peptide-methionine (S)-S-oxide reductase MsrA [Elusimicrobiota bacterium]
MNTKREEHFKDIYLAGGCFWGVQAYMDKIPGVIESQAGYANGKTENPSYEQVCKENTGHAETVRVRYDPKEISLDKLIKIFFEIIDPTLLNRQANDIGTQYRTGVYYIDETDRMIIQKVFNEEAKKYDKPIAVELRPLQNYYSAEDYHQKYLNKNSGGYCHIDLKGADKYKK